MRTGVFVLVFFGLSDMAISQVRSSPLLFPNDSNQVNLADPLIVKPARLIAWRIDSSAQGDSERVRALSKGYLSAHREGNGLALGSLYHFASIDLISPAPLPHVQAALQAWVGSVVSTQSIREVDTQVETQLRSLGFPFAKWNVSATVLPLDQKVAVQIVIDPGSGYKLGAIAAVGTKTEAGVLQRMSLLAVGETFDEKRLGQSLARLKRWGYYDRIDSLGLARDSSRNLISPLLLISDWRGNRLGGLLGYDNSGGAGDGITGFMDVHLINMRGTARDLDFNFESRPQGTGRSNREARLSFFEPWLPGLDLGLRLEGTISLQDSIYDQVEGHATLVKALDFYAQGEISVGKVGSHEYASNQSSDAITGGLGYVRDGRDQSPFPRRGLRTEIKALGIRRDLSDSSYYFSQLHFKSEVWIPLNPRFEVKAAVEAAGNAPMQSHFERGDLFQLGGARSLRGYREREFLTDLYGYSNFELQYIAGPRARAFLFGAPGLVNRLGGDIYWRRVLGYGLGLQLGSEAWAIALTYACNPERTLDNAFLHLEVENRF